MTDAALVERAARGSEIAFRALYRSYVRAVYAIAHGILHDAADAEDVVQETFVTAWSKLKGLTLRGESLLPWLATICRYHALNRRRARQRDRAQQLEDGAARADVADEVIARDLLERIATELSSMPELDRRIFLLCAGEGYDYARAAAELGVSHGTVRNRLSRTRTRLRDVTKENA